MKANSVKRYLFAVLLSLGTGILSGCLDDGSCRLMIDEVPFRIYPIKFPYDLPEEQVFYFYSPYNDELHRSMENIVMPFGVVCGGGDGLASGNYAEILLEDDGYSLSWFYEDRLKYSFDKGEARPQAYRLIRTDPDAPCGGDLICQPISLRMASTMTIVRGREQIVVFTPREVLIKRGASELFSCVKAPSPEQEK